MAPKSKPLSQFMYHEIILINSAIEIEYQMKLSIYFLSKYNMNLADLHKSISKGASQIAAPYFGEQAQPKFSRGCASP